MTENTVYTALLDSGEDQESVRLEFIDGAPQRTLTRSAVLDGEEIEVVWELEDDLDGRFVYRPRRVVGPDDDSGEVGREGDLTEGRGTSEFAGE